MIQIEGVRKVFPGRAGNPPTVALEEMHTQIEDGQFITVVGPSGCGKTTLLNIIAGFEAPTVGTVLVDGQPVTGAGADRAVVFQQASLYPWLNVRDNVAFGLTLKHGRRSVDQGRVDEMLEIMGLAQFSRHAPYELSGGMQQRVAIARALVVQPKILLMDEPFGALDAQTRGDMQSFLLQLWRRLRPTVLFITHDVEEAILLGDRVLVMTPRPGRLAEEVVVTLDRPREYAMVLTDAFTLHKRQILRVLRPDQAELHTG